VGNLCTTNNHLLILDCHNFHVMIDIVQNTNGVGLDFITLPSHTSHVLQLLDVVCLKPFKTMFRYYRNVLTLAIKGKGHKMKDMAFDGCL
jgi:hypothetical protein